MNVSDSAIRILAGLLEARTGQVLSINRRWRIETALSALLRQENIATLGELVSRLVSGRETALATRAVEALLNNETYFFRDRNPFDLLAADALPRLAERRRATRRLRIWSAGCSTGQEAYSLAMLFAEDPATWRGWTIDIVASDVSGTVIERAKAGVYTQFEVQRGLGIQQMIRWFGEYDGGWRADDRLRRAVKFRVHNILDAPPTPAGFDLILCRNVLLYLCAEKRALAFDRLASAMAPDGWLMLGAGETVIGQTRRLSADTVRRGLYQRVAEPETRSRREPGLVARRA